jgi:hypothetical protein
MELTLNSLCSGPDFLLCAEPVDVEVGRPEELAEVLWLVKFILKA